MTNKDARIELGQSVPHLRAMKDRLPAVESAPTLVTLDSEKLTVMLTDAANDTAHAFEFSSDTPLVIAIRAGGHQIFAPFN